MRCCQGQVEDLGHGYGLEFNSDNHPASSPPTEFIGDSRLRPGCAGRSSNRILVVVWHSRSGACDVQVATEVHLYQNLKILDQWSSRRWTPTPKFRSSSFEAADAESSVKNCSLRDTLMV